MWVLIDNYDSFTHILHHLLLVEEPDIRIYRNDEITVEELAELNPERIIISPGPQTPKEAGITNAVISFFYDKIPVLGICLGHQALGVYFGAVLQKATVPRHGKVSKIKQVFKSALFKDIPLEFNVMRYHSLIISCWGKTELVSLAVTAEKELMAFTHIHYPVIGLQFHPESILTEYGAQLIHNWAMMYK